VIPDDALSVSNNIWATVGVCSGEGGDELLSKTSSTVVTVDDNIVATPIEVVVVGVTVGLT